MSPYFSRISGWGMYAPDRVLTNDELAQMVDTSDESIVSRTGVRERHIAADDQADAVYSVCTVLFSQCHPRNWAVFTGSGILPICFVGYFSTFTLVS